MRQTTGQPGLPLWLKLLFSAWMLVWVPAYLWLYGPLNFFWLCNLANFLILAALWRESRLLLSAQALAVLLVGITWTLDVAGAFLTGHHIIGGTEYMFDAEIPLPGRLLSLYHAALPLITLYCLYRIGYDSRGIWLQTGLTWVLMVATWLVVEPELNINWVHGPFGEPQDTLPPGLYLLVAMLATPLVLYLPSHLLIRWLLPRQNTQ